MPGSLLHLKAILDSTYWENPQQRDDYWYSLENMVGFGRVNPTQAETLANLANKPSQFVGRILCISHAEQHLQQLAEWDRLNAAAQAEPLSADQREGTELDKAKAKWREAVQMRKDYDRTMQAWYDEEVSKLRAVKQERLLACAEYVAKCRREMDALK